ncbi:MAG: hypothetical protein U9N49_09870 [Campylobacterota bacterium]|nr:hypothetical protein [Campylobacterota bacterium]
MDFQALIENTLIIQRFTVFRWQDYYFANTGTTKDKYWITLNCKINDYPINVILPTSQYNNHHYANPTSLIDCVIIKKGESQYFDSPQTILDLKNIITEEESLIKEAYEEGFLCALGELESTICQKIEETIENSELLEPYIIQKLLCKE